MLIVPSIVISKINPEFKNKISNILITISTPIIKTVSIPINSSIDLVLMDINMPVIDGYIAAQIIKEFNPGLPIIAQTAFALDEDKEKYSDSFDDYITKPIIRFIYFFLNYC